MKRAILLTALLLVVAVPAMAAGLNFAWGTVCYTEAPVTVQTFACNVNTTTAAFQWPMQLSFATPADAPDLVALEGHIEGQSALADIPDYWKVGPTDCRPNAMSYGLDGSLLNADDVCSDWTGGNQSFPLIGYTWDTNRAHIVIGVAISAGTPQAITGGHEYYAGQLVFKNSKTVGTGACTGCSSEFILGFRELILSLLSGTTIDMADAMPSGNQCVWWNPPSGTPTLSCGIVPTRPVTWGQVKSLYR